MTDVNISLIESPSAWMGFIVLAVAFFKYLPAIVDKVRDANDRSRREKLEVDRAAHQEAVNAFQKAYPQEKVLAGTETLIKELLEKRIRKRRQLFAIKMLEMIVGRLLAIVEKIEAEEDNQ